MDVNIDIFGAVVLDIEKKIFKTHTLKTQIVKSSQIDRQTVIRTEEQRTTGVQENQLEPLVQVG